MFFSGGLKVYGNEDIIRQLYVFNDEGIVLDESRLEVEYFRTGKSLYDDDVVSTHISTSKNDCFNYIDFNDTVDFDASEIHDPLQIGYQVGGIAKNGIPYCRHLTDGATGKTTYVYPAQPDNTILVKHEPSELFGYDSDGDLVLAIVSSFHNDRDAYHQWLRDDEIIEGQHHVY